LIWMKRRQNLASVLHGISFSKPDCRKRQTLRPKKKDALNSLQHRFARHRATAMRPAQRQVTVEQVANAAKFHVDAPAVWVSGRLRCTRPWRTPAVPSTHRGVASAWCWGVSLEIRMCPPCPQRPGGL
jgi:hypothetical protein